MDDIIEILKNVGAIITNSHIVLTSGKHSSIYINKDALYPHTEETSRVGMMFAKKFKDADIDTIVAPAVGGTILSQWTAYHLSKLKKKEVFSVYTEKDKGTLASNSESQQVFRRGYDKYVRNKKVLVLEDLTATGGSVKKVVESVRAAGGTVIAVCVMVNRDKKNITSESIGAPFSSLGVFPAEAIEEKDCPMCKEGKPINTQIGHGKEYLAKKASK